MTVNSLLFLAGVGENTRVSSFQHLAHRFMCKRWSGETRVQDVRFRPDPHLLHCTAILKSNDLLLGCQGWEHGPVFKVLVPCFPA